MAPKLARRDSTAQLWLRHAKAQPQRAQKRTRAASSGTIASEQKTADETGHFVILDDHLLGHDERSSTLTIRRALIEDAETVSRLTRELYAELGHQSHFADFTQSVAFCQDIFEKDEYLAFLAFDEKGFASGIITLSEGISIYAGGYFGVIREFYVVPEMRCKRVGKALLEKARESAKSRGWRRIEVTLPSKDKWTRTYSFYAREGFEEIGPRLKYENLYE